MSRARRLFRVATLTVVFAAAVSALYARERTPELPEPPRGTSYLRESRTPDTYARDGFMELVSPIRPPTSVDGTVHINVFMKLPEGAAIHVLDRPSGGFTLRVPDGTLALRVESWGQAEPDEPPAASWNILDVRGTAFGAHGEALFVERPRTRGSPELLGLRWSRDASQAEPTNALMDLVRLGLVDAPQAQGEREAAATHLGALNDCAGCHVPERPARTRTTAPGIVNRGTDASGLFQLTSVFSDRLPIETYRPRDENLGRPFISYRCGDRTVEGDACDAGVIKEGVLDVRAGIRAHDRHTMRVCSARRELARRLDRIPSVIAAALLECE